MTFNPEGFTDMKDKYFLLNGRSYPDTVHDGPLATQTTDGALHYAQPMSSIIKIPSAEGHSCALRTWTSRNIRRWLHGHPDAGNWAQCQTAAGPIGKQSLLQHQLDPRWRAANHSM